MDAFNADAHVLVAMSPAATADPAAERAPNVTVADHSEAADRFVTEMDRFAKAEDHSAAVGRSAVADRSAAAGHFVGEDPGAAAAQTVAVVVRDAARVDRAVVQEFLFSRSALACQTDPVRLVGRFFPDAPDDLFVRAGGQSFPGGRDDLWVFRFLSSPA